MKLSIIIPSIRVDRHQAVLDSIKKSCTKYEYEVIFIGPFHKVSHDNVLYIHDMANPNICQHKALSYCSGDAVHIFSDDCDFEDGSIDICMDALIDKGCDAVVANYHEGGNRAVNNFSLNYCYAKTCTPDSFVIFNIAFMKKEKILALGGFDCSFETICVGQADLAARWQFSGFSVEVVDIRLCSCSHLPGTAGDHAPMHFAQLSNDIPLYQMKYLSKPNLVVDFMDWRNKPVVWTRRFNA